MIPIVKILRILQTILKVWTICQIRSNPGPICQVEGRLSRDVAWSSFIQSGPNILISPSIISFVRTRA